MPINDDTEILCVKDGEIVLVGLTVGELKVLKRVAEMQLAAEKKRGQEPARNG